jgi:hypothetical protein
VAAKLVGISRDELARFVECAAPGDVLVYAKGVNLAHGDEAVQDLAGELRRLWLAGRVELTQKRCGGILEYRATRRRDGNSRLSPWPHDPNEPCARIYSHPDRKSPVRLAASPCGVE